MYQGRRWISTGTPPGYECNWSRVRLDLLGRIEFGICRGGGGWEGRDPIEVVEGDLNRCRGWTSGNPSEVDVDLSRQ